MYRPLENYFVRKEMKMTKTEDGFGISFYNAPVKAERGEEIPSCRADKALLE